MSNWYPAEFTYAGLRFLSVQQYMMYHKVMLAGRYDLAKEIMNSDDPAVMEKIAGDGAFPEFTRIKNKCTGYAGSLSGGLYLQNSCSIRT